MIDYDLETSGLQPWSGKHKAFLYTFFDGEKSEAVWMHEPGAVERIQRWLDRGRTEGLRAWNRNFDRAFTEASGLFDVPGDGCWSDGMLVANAIDERRSVALKAVDTQLFGEGADALQKQVHGWLNEERKRRKKEARDAKAEFEPPNFSDVPAEIMEEYGLEDVFKTRRVCDTYAPVLEANDDLKRLVEFEERTTDATYAIEKRGMPARKTEYAQLEIEVNQNLDNLRERVDELAREAGVEDYNPNSSQQTIAVLKARGADFSHMSEKNGKLSADADNLRTIDNKLAVALLDYRSEAKVLSTYVQPMLGRTYETRLDSYKEPFVAPDGRIHSTYRVVGARTGRFSCSDPNMQNQPRDDLRLRYNIVADPGFKLVTCDLSNIEMVLFAAYAGEGKLLDAVRNGEDLHVLTAKMLGLRDRKRPGGGIESARQIGKTYNFCRPLDVDILTQQGWLTHEEVRVGDRTLGYNPSTRRNEWTSITAVHHFDDAPLVELSSGSWKATSTPEHTWVTEKMRRPELQTMKMAKDLNSEDRIILSAVAEGGTVATPTLDQVRRTDDWEQWVLRLTENARRAWLAGIALGEGSRSPGGTDTWTIAQNEGPLYEAIKLALYLEGYRPSTGVQHTKGAVPCKWVRAAKPSITGQRLVKREAPNAPVWCVTTELGSWTARENGEIGLTGNSRIYGGGLRTIRRSFRCSMDEARLLKKRFDQAYPETKRLQDLIAYRLEDQGYIQDKLISGRRFRVDPREAYKATNYLVQGTAASLLKQSVQALHADGVPMIGLVHDEVLCHVPEEDAEECKQLVIQRLTEHPAVTEYVPLAAEGAIVDRWSDAKPLQEKDGNGNPIGAPYLFTPEWAGGERREVYYA